MLRRFLWKALFITALITGCESGADVEPSSSTSDSLLIKYTTVRLTSNLAVLSERERQMIPLLIEAAREMDSAFWIQAYGDRDSLLNAISRPDLRRFAEINYGPWDRLADNMSFIDGVGPKPEGANFYPADIGRVEFDEAAAENSELKSLYTMVRRDSSGEIVAIPYHEYFYAGMRRAADKLREAARLAGDDGLRRYLELRAEALLTDDFQPSDLAWMEMKDNTIDVIIGPIETYEDQLFGLKAAYEAYVLIKDQDWSSRLARYAEMLPRLQRDLPVPSEYKRESPGTESDLGAYDAVYYAGDSNAGAKTIAVNLPNDEEVQLRKGARRLQLKNAMAAKFDEILVPIADVLIAEDQRDHVTFDAFFSNTMFHEVAHGLGIKNTIGGDETVRAALGDHHSAIEEGKADILGLYMITRLQEEGELDVDLMDNYVTFLAGIFRSVRFGAASAHGRANMVRFNFFEEHGAFERTDGGTYAVNFSAMQDAMNRLSEIIIRLQGDGDYTAVDDFVTKYGRMNPQLPADLERVNESGIPVDIVFEQGLPVLGIDDSSDSLR